MQLRGRTVQGDTWGQTLSRPAGVFGYNNWIVHLNRKQLQPGPFHVRAIFLAISS